MDYRSAGNQVRSVCLGMCASVVFVCVCPDKSILKALGMRPKLEAYELCTPSDLSLIRERAKVKNCMKEGKKDEATAAERKN